jgi:hypothetical protein
MISVPARCATHSAALGCWSAQMDRRRAGCGTTAIYCAIYVYQPDLLPVLNSYIDRLGCTAPPSSPREESTCSTSA